MLVYYDLLADKEIAGDSFEQTVPFPGIIAIEGKRITVSEGDIDIGANASAEPGDEDEGVDASEARTVINVVEAAHLQQIELSKKEFQTLIKDYYKKLIAYLTSKKLEALGFDEDNAIPTDKEAAKAAEKEALSKAGKGAKMQYEEWDGRIKTFKSNFDKIQAFVKDDIVANFDECEFYMVEEATLGTGMIIPARYVGEAVAPTFYVFSDGIRQKKE